MQNLAVDDSLLEQWLSSALLLPDDQFLPVELVRKLLARPLQESKGALSIFLQDKVDPHRGVSGVRWQAHAGTMDLLRAQYKAGALAFILTEGINFAFLKVGPVPENGRRAFLETLIRTVVKTDSAGHQWEFELPNQVEGRWTSLLITSRGAPPLRDLESRHDRADLLLWNEAVYFLFYKKVDQREGFEKADEWFSGPAHEALRRDQHK